MERHRQSHRDRRAEKRRDLARSTCSPLGTVAKQARQAKRNANRRERRAQTDALKTMRKHPCLCHEDPDVCPRCDHEVTHFDSHTSRPKYWRFYSYGNCYGERWAWDKFSQVYRWAESKRARLSTVEFEAEIVAFGSKPAHAHAIFHLLWRYFTWSGRQSRAPEMSQAALRSAVCERGVEWSPSVKPLLCNIAHRICTHGSFIAAAQWSYDLCRGLRLVNGSVVKPVFWSDPVEPKLQDPDDGWWVTHIQEGSRPANSIVDDESESYPYDCYRPLRGIDDVDSWCDEVLRFFDVFWGPRFLETPQGNWIIGELVKDSIPIRGTHHITRQGA